MNSAETAALLASALQGVEVAIRELRQFVHDEISELRSKLQRVHGDEQADTERALPPEFRLSISRNPEPGTLKEKQCLTNGK